MVVGKGRFNPQLNLKNRCRYSSEKMGNVGKIMHSVVGK